MLTWQMRQELVSRYCALVGCWADECVGITDEELCDALEIDIATLPKAQPMPPPRTLEPWEQAEFNRFFGLV